MNAYVRNEQAGTWVLLDAVLPCDWCGWMPLDCPCERPEVRANLFRLAPPSASRVGEVAA